MIFQNSKNYNTNKRSRVSSCVEKSNFHELTAVFPADLLDDTAFEHPI